MQKIKNIEFLRVFFIITIALYHIRVYLNRLDLDFFTNMFNMLDGARNGVEAFFIIAGFFLVLTFKNLPVFDFVKKKYFRLMPVAMFSIIICAIAWIFKINSFKFIPNIMMGLLLSHFGVYWCRGANIVLWFASALFFGLIVFYSIIKFVKEKYHLPIFAVLGFGGYFTLSLVNNGLYAGHSEYYLGFIPACTLRAFAGMGVGSFIAKLYQKYKDNIVNFNTNTIRTIMFSLIEIFTFGFIIWWSYFKAVRVDNSLYVISFVALFVCFLFKQGILSKLTDKDIWVNMGKYSYSLFCIHIPVARILQKTLLTPNRDLFCAYPVLTVIFTLSVCIICAIITYYIVEKPCYNWLIKKTFKSE